ncbi:MAG TPA: secretin N-terminal domain-containing protein [bacterium]|nr:secretin N-terminal domain-containing protein [bacterium]
MNRVAALCLTILLLATVAAEAEDKWEIEAGTVELRDFTKKVAQATGRVLIFGADFGGEIELQPAGPFNKDQLWNYLLATLDSQGWGVVLQGDVARVVKLAEMATQGVPEVVMSEPPAPVPAATITTTFELKHAEAEMIAAQLQRLAGPAGRVVGLPGQNQVVVVDTAANVERMRLVVERLDRAGETEKLDVVRLRKADPEIMAEILRRVFADYRIDGSLVRQRNGAGGLIVVTEPHSRTVVLRGNERDVNGAKALATRLDNMDDPVIALRRLRQARPEELGDLLRDLLR